MSGSRLIPSITVARPHRSFTGFSLSPFNAKTTLCLGMINVKVSTKREYQFPAEPLWRMS